MLKLDLWEDDPEMMPLLMQCQQFVESMCLQAAATLARSLEAHGPGERRRGGGGEGGGAGGKGGDDADKETVLKAWLLEQWRVERVASVHDCNWSSGRDGPSLVASSEQTRNGKQAKAKPAEEDMETDSAWALVLSSQAFYRVKTACKGGSMISKVVECQRFELAQVANVATVNLMARAGCVNIFTRAKTVRASDTSPGGVLGWWNGGGGAAVNAEAWDRQAFIVKTPQLHDVATMKTLVAAEVVRGVQFMHLWYHDHEQKKKQRRRQRRRQRRQRAGPSAQQLERERLRQRELERRQLRGDLPNPAISPVPQRHSISGGATSLSGGAGDRGVARASREAAKRRAEKEARAREEREQEELWERERDERRARVGREKALALQRETELRERREREQRIRDEGQRVRRGREKAEREARGESDRAARALHRTLSGMNGADADGIVRVSLLEAGPLGLTFRSHPSASAGLRAIVDAVDGQVLCCAALPCAAMRCGAVRWVGWGGVGGWGAVCVMYAVAVAFSVHQSLLTTADKHICRTPPIAGQERSQDSARHGPEVRQRRRHDGRFLRPDPADHRPRQPPNRSRVQTNCHDVAIRCVGSWVQQTVSRTRRVLTLSADLLFSSVCMCACGAACSAGGAGGCLHRLVRPGPRCFEGECGRARSR
jgi:hypothetical protein